MTDALEVNGTASSSETTKVRGAYATPVLQRFGVLSQRTGTVANTTNAVSDGGLVSGMRKTR